VALNILLQCLIGTSFDPDCFSFSLQKLPTPIHVKKFEKHLQLPCDVFLAPQHVLLPDEPPLFALVAFVLKLETCWLEKLAFPP
jgi:hypothetical protein